MPQAECMTLGTEVPVSLYRSELLAITAKMILGVAGDCDRRVVLNLLPADGVNSEHTPNSLQVYGVEIDDDHVLPYFAKLTGYPEDLSPKFDPRYKGYDPSGKHIPEAEVLLDHDTTPDTDQPSQELKGRMSIFLRSE